MPTTYSIDPYTGANVTHPGYHVENRTIELNIKNQPFTSYESNGQIINFYLNIRTKGHYAENWTTIYNPDFIYPTQSKSDYTKIAYSLDENEYPFWDNLNQSGLIDFQVQALIGYTFVKHYSDDGQFIPFAPSVFTGETSGWSNTQTITIPETSTSVSPSPTVPELPILVILPLFLAMYLIATKLLRRKQTSKSL